MIQNALVLLYFVRQVGRKMREAREGRMNNEKTS